MSSRETAIRTILGTASVAFWLAGVSVPAFADGQAKASPFDTASFGTIPEVTVEAPSVAVPAPGAQAAAAFIAGAGLKQYAMTNDQLGNVRGGFYTNGVQLSFGFQQLTSVNGKVVQSILVPNTDITSGAPITAYVMGGSVSLTTTPNVHGTYGTSSASVSGYVYSPSYYTKGSSVTSSNIVVSTGANNGATAIQTVLSGGAIVSSISNTANNQVIDQATTENINLSGLSASVAAAQAINNVLNALNRAGLIR